MAVATNTSETFDNANINEALSQILTSISPTEVPFFSAIGKGSVKNTLAEWPVYELAAPGDNRVSEGESDPDTDEATIAGRAQNYTQISDKKVIISDTAEAVDDAGKLQKMAKQMTIKTKELRRDMEYMLLDNVPAGPGGSGTARVTAGAMAWIKTNVSAGEGGGDPTVSGAGDFDGYPNAAATAGTTRAFTEEQANDVMMQCFNEGGQPSMMMVNPINKPVVSKNFTGNATKYNDSTDKRVVAAVDYWESDFGEVAVVPNRFLPTLAEDNYPVLFIDPDFWRVDFLYQIRQKELARTGHAERRLLQTEYALVCLNEKASGIVRDTSGAAA